MGFRALQTAKPQVVGKLMGTGGVRFCRTGWAPHSATVVTICMEGARRVRMSYMIEKPPGWTKFHGAPTSMESDEGLSVDRCLLPEDSSKLPGHFVN